MTDVLSNSFFGMIILNLIWGTQDMAFCSGCGAALSDGASFCDQCGKQLSARVSALQMASSKYGSINLASELANKYAASAKLKVEINDTEFSLKKIEISPNPPRYSFFRFYWPFFIIALIACFIVTLIFAFIAAGVRNSEAGYALAEIMGYLSVPVVLVIGIFIAKKRREAANEELEAKERTLVRKSEDLKKKLAELRNEQNEINNALSEFKDIVPASMRSKEQMLKVKAMLETGKADTFEDAVTKVRNPQKG